MAGLLKLLVWVLFLLTAAGFFGQIHWMFELVAPFRLQYLILLSLLTLFFGVRGDKQVFFAAFMATVINGWLVLPVFFEAEPLNTNEKLKPLKLLQINVSSQNTRYKQLTDVIQQLRPDVVTLEEVSNTWHNTLLKNPWIQNNLPYHARGVDSQTAIFSRYKLSRLKIHKVNPKYPVDNLLSAVVNTPITRVHLLVAHPPHPTSSMENWRQMVVFSYLVAHKADFQTPFILAGDLNTTPWSHHFQAMMRQMKLKDSRAGFGIHPTWPERWWPFRIPIDHVLVSNDITVLDHTVGLPTGSDHLPVVVKLGF